MEAKKIHPKRLKRNVKSLPLLVAAIIGSKTAELISPFCVLHFKFWCHGQNIYKH